jgi:hypothetical protein
MPAPKDDWLDQEAGPFVRPYAVTKGRTAPAKGRSIGLIDMVMTVPDARPPAGLGLGPGHREVLARCRRPVTVADLAADVDLPIGVVQVLLGDLTEHGMVRVVATPKAHLTNRQLLNAVLDGLKAL